MGEKRERRHGEMQDVNKKRNKERLEEMTEERDRSDPSPMSRAHT